MNKSIITATVLAAAVALGGCATMPGGLGSFGRYGGNERPYPNSANVYTPGESQQIQHVQLGIVLAVQPVAINASGDRRLAGEGIGAVAGGVLGHQIGGGSGKTIATIAGAVGGAVAGDAVAGHGYRQQGLQVTIQLDNHQGTIAVTQQTGPTFRVGERVEVIGGGYDQPARVEPLD